MPSKPKLTFAEQLKQFEARILALERLTLERMALQTHVPIGEFKSVQVTTTAPRFTTISRE